jgi:hypothetical protein
MSLLSRAPRQVYEVHGEDDYLADDSVAPSKYTVHQLDASVEGSRSGRVLGLALLVVVTLGALALVLLHVSHTSAGRQSVAERRVSSAATRRAAPDPLTTALPEVHTPQVHTPPYSKRHTRASTSSAARPRRRDKRIVGGHAQPPKIVVIGQAGDRSSPVPAWAAGEFDFER